MNPTSNGYDAGVEAAINQPWSGGIDWNGGISGNTNPDYESLAGDPPSSNPFSGFNLSVAAVIGVSAAVIVLVLAIKF
jgi:hypothetical protein